MIYLGFLVSLILVILQILGLVSLGWLVIVPLLVGIGIELVVALLILWIFG